MKVCPDNATLVLTFTVTGVANSLPTPDGLAPVLACFTEVGVCINLLTPVGLAGVLFTCAWNSSFTPTRLVLFLDFFPVDNGDTNISPGPLGVSGISAYRTESGVPVLAGVEGEIADLAGVLNKSPTPPRLVLPIDFLLAFYNRKKQQFVNRDSNFLIRLIG